MLGYGLCLFRSIMKAHRDDKSHASKRARTPHIDRLPEPARSIGRDVLEHGVDSKSAHEAETLAAHQAEEWIASRAPTARPVREHTPKRKS